MFQTLNNRHNYHLSKSYQLPPPPPPKPPPEEPPEKPEPPDQDELPLPPGADIKFLEGFTENVRKSEYITPDVVPTKYEGPATPRPSISWDNLSITPKVIAKGI